MFWVLLGRLRLQDNLGWSNALHGLSSSRRANQFWYINRPNPRSYATCGGEKVQAVFSSGKSEWKAYHPSENIAIQVKAWWPSEKFLSEWNFGQGVGVTWRPTRTLVWQSEWSLLRVKPSETLPSEILLSEILPSGILPSEWNYSK
jgi:hypothetical protein